MEKIPVLVPTNWRRYFTATSPPPEEDGGAALVVCLRFILPLAEGEPSVPAEDDGWHIFTVPLAA